VFSNLVGQDVQLGNGVSPSTDAQFLQRESVPVGLVETLHVGVRSREVYGVGSIDWFLDSSRFHPHEQLNDLLVGGGAQDVAMQPDGRFNAVLDLLLTP
jgi:hypothetical protein